MQTKISFKQSLVLIFAFVCLPLSAQEPSEMQKNEQKMAHLIQLVRYMYVDPVEMSPITEKGIEEMLKQLDPHSVYISAKDVAKANEPLLGNFDGIGVSFQIVKDTIVIVDVISGGPSEKLGIMAGDKIIKIDSLNSTGDSATTDFVFRHLRGKKGSKVEVSIVRKGNPKVLVYTIVRDKIPINSVDTYFMENKQTAYIRLDRFAKTTMEEIRNAIADLQTKGMQNLILDLRGNSGGYLDVAVQLADEFLGDKKLVVYMEGKAQAKQEFFATQQGAFEKGKLVIMIDEGSASASEIVSGAMQDWDRGVVVGRRSFGKGLVQRPFDLPDESNVRLTTARYYTPSGRCIQKPYVDGLESYYADVMNRYTHGEMLHPDSVKLPDSLKYKTANQRIVYGGGGIMPDVFIPIDTQRISDYYVDLRRNNVLNNFVMDLMDKDRNKLLKIYPDFKTFKSDFKTDTVFMNQFEQYAEKAGVKHKNMKLEKANYYLKQLIDEMAKDSLLAEAKNYAEYMQKVMWSPEKIQKYLLDKAQEEDKAQLESIQRSEQYIEAQLKALIARNLYGISYYYQIIKEMDDGYQRALKIVEDKKVFDKLKLVY
ncbi:MAG: S41 family peptidase [Bacteroidales bacterium]